MTGVADAARSSAGVHRGQPRESSCPFSPGEPRARVVAPPWTWLTFAFKREGKAQGVPGRYAHGDAHLRVAEGGGGESRPTLGVRAPCIRCRGPAGGRAFAPGSDRAEPDDHGGQRSPASPGVAGGLFTPPRSVAIVVSSPAPSGRRGPPANARGATRRGARRPVRGPCRRRRRGTARVVPADPRGPIRRPRHAGRRPGLSRSFGTATSTWCSSTSGWRA